MSAAALIKLIALLWPASDKFGGRYSVHFEASQRKFYMLYYQLTPLMNVKNSVRSKNNSDRIKKGLD